MTSSYPSLTRALAEALVDVLWFIGGSEDEQMDQDDAVDIARQTGPHWFGPDAQNPSPHPKVTLYARWNACRPSSLSA